MAINSKKLKLKTVLMSNKKWPLIIAGATATDFNAPVMPAKISARDLNTGEWVGELINLKKNQMVVDGLDKLSIADQQKFITLLKDRRVGPYKFPTDIQIIIPVKFADKLDRTIKDLCLIYNV